MHEHTFERYELTESIRVLPLHIPRAQRTLADFTASRVYYVGHRCRTCGEEGYAVPA